MVRWALSLLALSFAVFGVGVFTACPLLCLSAASDLALQHCVPHLYTPACTCECVCACAEVLIALLLNAPKLIDSDVSSNLSDPGFLIFDACALIRRLTLNRNAVCSLVCLNLNQFRLTCCYVTAEATSSIMCNV